MAKRPKLQTTKFCKMIHKYLFLKSRRIRVEMSGHQSLSDRSTDVYTRREAYVATSSVQDRSAIMQCVFLGAGIQSSSGYR